MKREIIVTRTVVETWTVKAEGRTLADCMSHAIAMAKAVRRNEVKELVPFTAAPAPRPPRAPE